MIQRLAPLARRLDQDLHLVAQLVLADHFMERTRAQRMIDLLFATLLFARDRALGGRFRFAGLATGYTAFIGHIFSPSCHRNPLSAKVATHSASKLARLFYIHHYTR